MIEFETDIASEDLLKGGGAPSPGVYHCQIEQATEHPTEGYIELNCVICSPGSECGKTFHHRCYFIGATPEKTITCRKITLGTAIRLGLTTQAAYDADRAAGRSHGVEWLNSPGKQFIGDLKAREYDRQDGSKGQGVNASIYSIDDEKAGKRVTAFDKELLSLVLPNGPTTTQAQTMTQQPAAQPPATAPAQSRPANVAQQQPTQQAAQATIGGSIYDDI